MAGGVCRRCLSEAVGRWRRAASRQGAGRTERATQALALSVDQPCCGVWEGISGGAERVV